MKTKICVFTATRAEYGLLRPLIERIDQDESLELVLLVSGTHLSSEYGMTVNDVQPKSAIIPVEILLSSDTAVGVAKSFGLGVIGFSDALARAKPDWCIIAGDRSEALACAATCVMLSIPIAHLHGGETTGGSLDEYYRHAITKLSRLHFVSTAVYAARLIRMGEAPSTVFNVGAIGLDNLRNVDLMAKPELEADLGVVFQRRNVLFTYHPEHLLDGHQNTARVKALLVVLLRLEDTLILITGANSDENGRLLNALYRQYANEYPSKLVVFDSLGTRRYFSLMTMVDVVVGNSSSGIIEAPSFGVPTVNVGSRQLGRVRAESVVDCHEHNFEECVRMCMEPEFQKRMKAVTNPYGSGNAAEQIVQVIASARVANLVKNFYEEETTNKCE